MTDLLLALIFHTPLASTVHTSFICIYIPTHLGHSIMHLLLCIEHVVYENLCLAKALLKCATHNYIPKVQF